MDPWHGHRVIKVPSGKRIALIAHDHCKAERLVRHRLSGRGDDDVLA